MKSNITTIDDLQRYVEGIAPDVVWEEERVLEYATEGVVKKRQARVLLVELGDDDDSYFRIEFEFSDGWDAFEFGDATPTTPSAAMIAFCTGGHARSTAGERDAIATTPNRDPLWTSTSTMRACSLLPRFHIGRM